MRNAPVRHRLEYIAVRATAALLRALPYRCALGLSWVLARIAFCVARPRARVAVDRIRTVFGTDISEKKAWDIAWCSFRNLVFSMIDMMRLRPLSPRDLQRLLVNPEDLEAFRTAFDGSHGAIIATPHMGSWELAALVCHQYVAPLCVISADHHNPFIASYFERVRKRFGIDTLVRGTGIITDILSRFRRGCALAILPDVRVPTPDIRIEFLGGTANISRGMALFAKIADVPVYPCVVTREGWTRHRIRFFPAIRSNKALDKEADIRRITADVMNIIEKEVRTDPAQWFWFNRRWILDPVTNSGPNGQHRQEKTS